MIQRNNSLSVLPFYTDIDEQLHRRSYAYGAVYPLYTPVGKVPQFQIIVPHSDATLTFARLYNKKGTLVSSILSNLQANGLSKFQFTDYDVIVYPHSGNGSNFSTEGQYYLSIGLSDNSVWYSDVFTAVGGNFMDNYLKIEWYDAQDLIMDNARVVYQLGTTAPFRNVVYLNTELGKPEYEFNEEGEERDGFFFPEKQISQKKYKCNILASEALCDVMRLIRLSDYVRITDRYGHTYRPDTFLMTPKWEEQGNLASVDIEFTCDTVAKKIPRPLSLVGDYNVDYNDDYFNY